MSSSESNVPAAQSTEALSFFEGPTRRWFESSFTAPTKAQQMAWPAIAKGESALISAPTGSGKTLTAFLYCIDRLMFGSRVEGCSVIYISPLKALAVDVERNLRSPIAGISNSASDGGPEPYIPSLFIRTGDTPSRERSRFVRNPDDILITTPESFYLMLTSRAASTFTSVRTVIIDEIHALVGNKRGAHLALSLERLEEITENRLQRIGLSATQRPLEEVARFLGGFSRDEGELVPRPVSIVDTEERKRLELSVQVPVEDMARLGEKMEIPSGAASQPEARYSIWPSIHPRLLDLIRQHRSTLIFVNSRRLAERLAAALNELAEETIAHAHHGSISRAQRVEIEDSLKEGRLPALVATSSLELGIDMGALDLVIQIESPPSVSSALQRIGRANHHVGGESRGVIFPKYRSDLVACAALVSAMKSGAIEETRYQRNPLDILAQHLVSMAATGSWTAESARELVTRAAPFAELSAASFESVLDMLSGAYPSDDFAELRPRVNWNRISGQLTARRGAQRVSVANAGTIPDRGLYGVFLAGDEGKTTRVGELDEEMVFESREGETFLLGASTWRIEQITWDRVIVSPAPGEPGKMPFWKGESADRSVELGRQIGTLLETIERGGERTRARLTSELDLDELAADNLISFVREQKLSSAVPTDRNIVIERGPDELGDWRICVLSPLGGRVHAPWAIGVAAMIREERGIDVETMWTDDGFVVRFPESEDPPDLELFFPDPEEIQELVTRQLSSTSLFAARFRENAARALLLPRRRPGSRTPLWQQRKRASDLLQVAARFSSFPIILETYRECLRDVFDLPALREILRKTRSGEVRSTLVETDRPSPFASSILFRYVANYLYDGDAPLAERRAQALSVDPAQLRELIGEVELRELLEQETIDELALRLQYLDPRMELRGPDDLHDLLLRLGDLTETEIADRTEGDHAEPLQKLVAEQRAVRIQLAGEPRVIAVEYAGRYRDALGVPLPPGLPERLLAPTDNPIESLVMTWSRTHPPFTAEELAARYGVGKGLFDPVLRALEREGRLVHGQITPARIADEFCDQRVLRRLRRTSLARLRSEIEPVEAEAYASFLVEWQGISRPLRGLDALLDAIEIIEGYPVAASILETEILPARVEGFRSSDLDTLATAGEIVWRGVEPLGSQDGRIALYLTDHVELLAPAPDESDLDEEELEILSLLRTEGPSLFDAIQSRIGGFPTEVLERIWSLVWKGLVTNDSLHPLRALRGSGKARRRSGRAFRSRRAAPRGAEGRWRSVRSAASSTDQAEQRVALVNQFLKRYGVLPREAAAAENLTGGFSTLYPVLRQLEEAGRIRRGMFVSGLAATQFAMPAAVDRLRAEKKSDSVPHHVRISATDPANPWGAVLRWPDSNGDRRPQRSVGTEVVLIEGALTLWIARGGREVLAWLPEDEPNRTHYAEAAADALASPLARGRRAVLIASIDSAPPEQHPIGQALIRRHGFSRSSMGLQKTSRG